MSLIWQPTASLAGGSRKKARETLADLQVRRTEILAKINQNSPFGCKKPACESPLYPAKYPASRGPQHSVGYFGPSAMETHRSQPSVDVRHQCYNERSIVIIDPRTDQQTGLSSSLQERSIVHEVLPPGKVHTSVCSTPGLLHSTTLFTAVTDSVSVAKASALEKTGSPPYLSSPGPYVPWSSEECGTSLEEDGGEFTDLAIHGSSVSWFKVNQQDGNEMKSEMMTKDYTDFENCIPFYPRVSGFGPISRLSTTAKFKMTETVNIISESPSKLAQGVTGEQVKTTTTSSPSHFTIEEILSQDIYPIIPTKFSTDDIILRKHTTIGPKSEQQHTWECCIPTSQNYLHEELTRLQNKLASASNSDERLAYELQAIEFKISLTNGETFVPLGGLVNKLDTIHNQEDHELPGMPLLGSSNNYLGLPIQLDVHDADSLNPKRQQERMDEQFSRQLIMEELDAQLTGFMQPRNT